MLNQPNQNLVSLQQWCQKLANINNQSISLTPDILAKVLRQDLVKFSSETQAQQKQLLHQELLKKSIYQISGLILKIIYTPNIKHHLRYSNNLIGLYQTIKHIISNQKLSMPLSIKSHLKEHLLELLLTRIPFSMYVQFKSEEQQNHLLENFLQQIDNLIKLRVQQFELTYNLQMNQFVEKIFECFLKQNLEQYHRVTVDWIILCSVYASYKYYKFNILFGKLCDIYEQKTHLKIYRQQLLTFYNKKYLSVFTTYIGVIKTNQVKILYPLLKQVLCQIKNEYQVINT